MDIKSRLNQYADEYERFKKSKENEIKKIYEQYQPQAASEQFSVIKKEVEAKRSECVSAVSNELKSIANDFEKQYLKRPDNYDIKLNTTINLLTSIGKDATESDLKEWLAPFKYDYKTMLTFSKIIKPTSAGFTLLGYNRIPEIVTKLNNAAEKAENFFSGPAMPPGTALNGNIQPDYSGLNLLFFCDAMTDKMESVKEFVDNF
jgi:hypothetical protein